MAISTHGFGEIGEGPGKPRLLESGLRDWRHCVDER